MRQSVLKIINPILMLILLIQFVAVSSLSSGVGEGHELGKTIFLVHKFNGMAFVVVGITHLIFNWNWVKMQFKGAKS